MPSEQIENRIDKLFKYLDVDSRIKAIEDLTQELERKALAGEDVEEIRKQIFEIRDTVPERQIPEFNQKIFMLQQKMINKFLDISKLVQIWDEARLLKLHKIYLLNILHEMVVAMNIKKQVENGNSDIMSIAPLILKSPTWFVLNPPELEKIYKEKVEYPEGICHLFLTSKLEDIEIKLLPQKEQDKITKLEAEMESLPEDEEGTERWNELYDEKMNLLPFTKDTENDNNNWYRLHERERELIKEFQEIAKIYDASFTDRIKDMHILSPDLVYELIEIAVKNSF